MKKTFTVKDDAGKVVSTGEQTIVDSGVHNTTATGNSASSAARGAAPQAAPLTLQAAYEAGLVTISVEVDSKVTNGDRLRLIVEGRQPQPITLTLPAGQTSLRVGRPFEQLLFQPSAAQTLEVSARKSASFVATQHGMPRVIGGKFEITISDGKPLFRGSATVSPPK